MTWALNKDNLLKIFLSLLQKLRFFDEINFSSHLLYSLTTFSFFFIQFFPLLLEKWSIKGLTWLPMVGLWVLQVQGRWRPPQAWTSLHSFYIMASAQPYWDQHHDHDTMDKWVWAAVLSSNGCYILRDLLLQSPELTPSIFICCRLFFGFGLESMDHSLRMYQQNSANVGFESKWAFDFEFINYITIWSLSVLEACCGCFSGSAEGYRKCMIVICSADKWILW